MRTDVPIPKAPEAAQPHRRRHPLVRALVAVTIAGLLGLLALAGLAGWAYSRADMSNLGQLDFANELKIPPLLEPRVDAAGDKVFDLRLQQGSTELLPGKPAGTWGANGAYLGPTLRASRGDRVRINVTNTLPEATTLHWHGMHLPARADGGPHQMVAPGTTWSPTWTIDQPAATLWYHPHPHGQTEDHTYRGISGLFLLDDPQARVLPLPKRYGVDDIPVIIQDKRFRADGQLDFGEPLASPTGRRGGDILVNGTYGPHLQVASQLVRFRMLNASTARTYNLGFADNRAFDLIATDGGLLEAPYRTKRVPLSPGERAEIVAEFRPGERALLRSFQPDLGLGSIGGRLAGADDTFDLLQVRAAGELRASPPLPARLARHQPLDPATAVTTRRIELTGSSAIDGKSMDIGRIDQVVTVDTTEIWEVRNGSGNLHNFHVHDVQFKVLEYGGEAPPPTMAGWKDTVPLPPGRTARLVIRFTDYTDPSSPYMFHCHLLRHEDNGMMGQFVVVQPGQAASPPSHQHHG
jgi:FtsP/CotA-like multicopper oxidase with cupredoxin domain